MALIKNIHEKLMESVQIMLIDTKVSLPFYGNFALFITFHERKDIDTCGVNMTSKGMQFYYSPEFLDRMSQKEVNFITLHEEFHLLWNHPKRTITGQYDHKLSNIAQDMIINHVIWEDIKGNFVEIPKDEQGRNMALFIPKEYTGKLIFEEVYSWLRDKQDEHKKNKEQNKCKTCDGTGEKKPGDGQKSDKSDKGQGGEKGDPQNQKGQENGDGKGQGDPSDKHEHGEGEACPDCKGEGQKPGSGKGNGEYGPYGKDPKSDNGTIDTYSLDQLFDNLEKNQGQYLDVHMEDGIPEEMREAMIKDSMERLQARGLSTANVEGTLNKLRKQRKDYLKHIKRSVSNLIFGVKKSKTIVKPNRRQIAGLKGNRKVKSEINCILDVSGSMNGLSERVLSYITRQDISINFIEADTEVKLVKKVNSIKELERTKIIGGGGTTLNPSIEFIADNYNNVNTVILTDGYCDNLDFSRIKGNVLIISAGVKCPIARTNGKVKQIVIERED